MMRRMRTKEGKINGVSGLMILLLMLVKVKVMKVMVMMRTSKEGEWYLSAYGGDKYATAASSPAPHTTPPPHPLYKSKCKKKENPHVVVNVFPILTQKVFQTDGHTFLDVDYLNNPCVMSTNSIE